MLTGETNMDVLVSYRKQYEKKADTCMTQHTHLFPETAEVLTALKNRGAKLGIVSSKYRSRIQELTDVAFPKGFFDLIVGAEDVNAHKPSPEGLLFSLRHLQTDLVDALYVGDSTIDAETAQTAKVDFCGILHGLTTYDELAVYPYQAIAKDLHILL
jgi:phosphoglycolate phosphatase